MPMGLVLEEVLEEVQEEVQVEPKGFQVQGEVAEGVLEEAKEVHVGPDPGRQLEDVQADWDTGGEK